MPPATPRKLTERQGAVMERIDRRVPIKVIAQELGVSETRINQHIRALKDIYGAGSLGDLVELYRASRPAKSTEPKAQENGKTEENQSPADSPKGFSEPAYSNSQVPSGGAGGTNGAQVDQGELVMSDVLPLLEQAPWLRPGEPRVVPGVLDGEHAALFRLGAIIVIAFGILAAVVLLVTAAVSISEALEGRAAVPTDEQGFS
ncbi:hypothetical protein [uncultured Erythrobacter sp.]|uniref:helix-turn-helix transcriptional regulator n=2 Tax=uncultured Erythrobacter sp. TaxID=263913 RepID=UPI00260246BC|nr:hypothetical protein [uncultured Erythrobacter sp.]